MRSFRIWIVAAVVATSIVGGLLGAFAARDPSPYRKLKLFAHVLSLIEQYYVEDTNDDVIVSGAIKGMIRELDPHSTFFTPDEYRNLIENINGEFGGVGIEVGIREGILTVLSPIPDTPASRADIAPGDQIVAIEDQPTGNMSIEDSVLLMRGTPGTTVTATFVRKGHNGPFDVTLVREVITVDSVKDEYPAKGYLHLRVRTFQENTSADVRASIEAAKKKFGRLKGILLDLRRNPGGMFREAIRVVDLFVDSGVIVSTRGRHGAVLREYSANRRSTYIDIPIVVLIDGGSASASEIVAGALRDHGRALLVGMRTFGKGSVQSTIDLPDGYGLKITTSRYYTPAGRSIQAEGIVPDVVIESRKAPTPDKETLAISSTGESDLPGHLPSENGEGADAFDGDEQIEDFQMRVAFQLLRGLSRPGIEP